MSDIAAIPNPTPIPCSLPTHQANASLQLPPELYRGIIQHYSSPDDISTLHTLTLTSRDLGFEAERVLYQNIAIHHPYRQYLALRALLKSDCKWKAKLVKTWKFDAGSMKWVGGYGSCRKKYEGEDNEGNEDETGEEEQDDGEEDSAQGSNASDDSDASGSGHEQNRRGTRRTTRIPREYSGHVGPVTPNSNPASSSSSPNSSPITIHNPLQNMLLTAPMLSSPITHPITATPNNTNSPASPISFPYSHPDAPIIQDLTLMIQALGQILPYMTNLKVFVLKLGAYTNHVHCAMKLGQALAECEFMRLERFIWDFWSDEEGVLEFLKRQLVVRRGVVETESGDNNESGEDSEASEEQSQQRVEQRRMEGGMVELGFQWSRPTSVARVWSSLSRNINTSALSSIMDTATTLVVSQYEDASSSSPSLPPILTPLHIVFQNVKSFSGNMNSIRAFLPYQRNIQKLTWIADSHDHIESVMQRELIPQPISLLIQKRVRSFVLDGLRKRLDLSAVIRHLRKVESLELVGYDPAEFNAILALHSLKQLIISTRKQGQFTSFQSLPSPSSSSSPANVISSITASAATSANTATTNNSHQGDNNSMLSLITSSQSQIALVKRLFAQHIGLEKVNIHIKYVEFPSDWYRQWKRDMEDWEKPLVVHKTEIEWCD